MRFEVFVGIYFWDLVSSDDVSLDEFIALNFDDTRAEKN